MRYLILSDIHAHEEKLERVLDHANKQGWDMLVSLGDVVGGMGQQPEATVQRLRALQPLVSLRGNHEAAVLAVADGESVNDNVAARHASQLSATSLGYLRSYEMSYLNERWGAVHGGLRHPWEYLISIPVVSANLPLMERSLYFVGHTHVAGAFLYAANGTSSWTSIAFRKSYTRLLLPTGSYAFVNPGSISEPRDGLMSSSYVIFDEDSSIVEAFRI